MSPPMGHIDASFCQNRARGIPCKRNSKAVKKTLTGGFQPEICAIADDEASFLKSIRNLDSKRAGQVFVAATGFGESRFFLMQVERRSGRPKIPRIFSRRSAVSPATIS